VLSLQGHGTEVSEGQVTDALAAEKTFDAVLARNAELKKGFRG
jgi:hypothetical protein